MVAPGVSLGWSVRRELQPPEGAKMAHTFTNLLIHMVFSTYEAQTAAG